jgi:hypothetical protein
MKYLWNGNEFFVATDEEAKKLIAEDKAEDESSHGNSHFRYRHEFTGYHTRELRADAPIAPVPEAKTEEPDMPAQNPKDHKSWRQYKKEVGQALGKPASKVTKAEVEEYLNGNI